MNTSKCFPLIAVIAGIASAITAQQTSHASQFLAGPMVGHVTESTAIVWVRVASGTDVRAFATQSSAQVRSVRTEQPIVGFTKFHFSNLKPSSPVHVEIRATTNSDTPTIQSRDLVFTTASPPEYTGTLRIAFGSCSQDSRRPYVPVFEAMAFEQPDLAVWVGDNSYFVVGEGDWSTSGPIGDWNSREQMISRHMRTRTNPYLQNLLRTTPLYAVWDDHDYGPNNSDRELESKEDALEIFKAVWANPGYGTPRTPGVFSKFRRGPADIFLMDGRYHKYVSTSDHPDVSPKNAVIWGDEQLAWLCDELKRSTAPVKVIANGTQVIAKDGRGEGHFNEAPEEIAKLLTFLKENEIGGVVFLTGDRHITEVLRLEQEDGPDLIEFTSSPMQQGQAVEALERDHPTHEWAMRGNSYGLVTIEVEGENEGSIKFEMRDANNYVPLRNGEPAIAEYSLESLQYK